MSNDEEAKQRKDGLRDRLITAYPQLEKIVNQLHDTASDNLFMLLDEIDAAAKLAVEFPKVFKPADVAQHYQGGQRIWELIGRYFLHSGRIHEAAHLFSLLYEHLLAHQDAANERIHKGVALFWFAKSHSALGHAVTAKRYLMLTLCEDAIKDEGHIEPKDSGSYSALVSHFGLPDALLCRYVQAVWKSHQSGKPKSYFPEWILQQLDQEWMTEVPSANEAGLYTISRRYAEWLLHQTGNGTGKPLEQLAEYLIGAMPGCRAIRRVKSQVSEYDVVVACEGAFQDFRSELGRYFLVECKDWSRSADFTTVAKFCRVLDSAKCRFGILFSKKGVSGQKKNRDAVREIVKVYQDRGVVIVVVTRQDLDRVMNGENFITMLRSKYERVRLDLPEAKRQSVILGSASASQSEPRP